MPTRPLVLLAGLRGLLEEAKLAPQAEVRENAHAVERALRRNQLRKLTDPELLTALESHRDAMRRLLRAHKVKAGGRLERLTLGLLDALRARVVARLPSGPLLLLAGFARELLAAPPMATVAL